MTVGGWFLWLAEALAWGVTLAMIWAVLDYATLHLLGLGIHEYRYITIACAAMGGTWPAPMGNAHDE